MPAYLRHFPGVDPDARRRGDSLQAEPVAVTTHFEQVLLELRLNEMMVVVVEVVVTATKARLGGHYCQYEEAHHHRCRRHMR